MIDELKQKVLEGGMITKKEAVLLSEAPLEPLTEAADQIRRHFCGNKFDMCTIINGKCGKCSEDCKYCGQSAHFETGRIESYPLLPTEKLMEQAVYNKSQGVLRYSIVTSGKDCQKRKSTRCARVSALSVRLRE